MDSVTPSQNQTDKFPQLTLSTKTDDRTVHAYALLSASLAEKAIIYLYHSLL